MKKPLDFARGKGGQMFCKNNNKGGQEMGMIYFLGFIGALVYYIQHAATFGAGVMGVLKAMVWPAMIIYQLMGMLKM